MRRVVVTGIGAVTPIGNNVADMWEAVKEGKCGIAPITLYDTSEQKVKLAAEVKDFHPETVYDKKELRRMDRFTQFAVVAAAEAMQDCDIDLEKTDLERFGIIVSSGIGGLNVIQNENKRGAEKGYDKVMPYFIPMAISNLAAGQIAIKYGLHGMCSCVVTACAGGTNAIGDAFRHIRDGYADIMMAGGTEACITNLGIGGFTSMQALSTSEDPNRASIPFDKERNGFVMGEGAGMLVLEEYEHAVARGAKIYCEVSGYGVNCDAYHITAPSEDAVMASKCLEMAIKEAGIKPEDIDYINAHGTSTKLNDKGETKAIKKVFGDHAYKLAVSSTKAMTGHMIAATGAVEGIITALSIKNDYIPATINYRIPDEECDLDIVPNEGREAKVDYALSNSLGFGGHNACIIMNKVDKRG
jgi:3-oxoacyl-[acyl-carrier-protein] synthase II